ncbi:MAG: hypothetical protein AAB116_10245 [Candidatus Poribacteria bacterium]
MCARNNITLLNTTKEIANGVSNTKHPIQCKRCGFGKDRQWQKDYFQMRDMIACHKCVLKEVTSNKAIKFSKTITTKNVLMYDHPLEKSDYEALPTNKKVITVPAISLPPA